MPITQFKLVTGRSTEHSTLSAMAKFKINSASFGDHVNALCVSGIGSAAPTAAMVQNVFITAYNDGIVTYGFTPGESQTIAKAGILAYIACYGIVGANAQQACLACACAFALSVSLNPKFYAYLAAPSYGTFSGVEDLDVLFTAQVAVCAQLAGSAQSAAIAAINTYLTANGFWFP